MFIRIWQFRAQPERVREFREAYGSAGAWAKLFARGDGYLGTELLESTSDPTLHVTIDRWESAEAWAAFLHAWREEYAALDRQCESLTRDEVELGVYVAPAQPRDATPG
jgi:heme-degrading monooxygenase HmoA